MSLTGVSGPEGEYVTVAVTCGECGAEGTISVPASFESVVFEPPCGHKNIADNPHAAPATEEQVAMDDAGSGTDTVS
jgi:hypothetical protein